MFTKDFKFGISMSGFQFEMGGEDSLDPNTDWFVWVRDPVNLVSGLVSGDLPENGPDYWNRFREDHDLMRELGLNAIRIGLEWSRIFPRSTESVNVKMMKEDGNVIEVDVDEKALKELENVSNEKAVERYREIMEDIKSKGMYLMVDLNHFTLPIWIHDPIEVRKLGIDRAERSGWYSEKVVVEFAKFAAFVAWKFGDIVDEWSTLNEPQVVSSLGYLLLKSGFPPAYPSEDAYIRSMINQAQAHSRAYDMLKKYSSKPVGLIYSFSPAYPLKSQDKDVVEKANYYQNFWFMDMITFGRIGDLFGGEELIREDMKGKLDFIGVNYYTRSVIKREEGELGWSGVEGYGYSCVPNSVSKGGYPTSDFGWEVFPKGLYDTLKMVYGRYGLEMIVTENGIADSKDSLRPYFLVSHLYSVERALEDGIPVKGYLHWSLVDNYEWPHGFRLRFGLVHVDFSAKKRSPRPSAYLYSKIVERETVENMVGSIPFGVQE